jgi:hypothetical protein
MTLRVVLLVGAVGMACEASAQTAVDARMQAWSKALGVECVHCHVQDNWTDASKPTFEFAQRMSRMLAALNAGPLNEVGEISCWTCHRGRSIPARLAREKWEAIRTDHASEFANTPNRALAMSVYAASLGVDCTHCHETDRTLNTKAPKAMVAKMLPIFDEIPKHFEKARMPLTQCFMCHQGKPKPDP